MIKIENTEVVGWEAAIRGMRNPMNSWEKSKSAYCRDFKCSIDECPFDDKCNDQCSGGVTSSDFIIHKDDHDLMMRLAMGGSVHAKYRRMIVVYADITAPLYWWKEFDTYKVGTVSNSCSTMHKIHEKKFTLEDFSTEHLDDCLLGTFIPIANNDHITVSPKEVLERFTISSLNHARTEFLETKDKRYWWQMIQLLPSSYNQRRTVMLNYEVLAGIYTLRKDHKLDEWREFCQWIEQLPYSEIITAKPEKKIEITGWRPISEYDRKNYDWVLVKCFDGSYECIPTVAEMIDDGLWYEKDGLLPFAPSYFFDMQQLDNRESEG